MSKLPRIEIRDTFRTKEMAIYDVDIKDEEFFKKTCDQARIDIPDEELFNWWINEALKESVEHIESMNKFQHLCYKLKIKWLQLTKQI